MDDFKLEAIKLVKIEQLTTPSLDNPYFIEVGFEKDGFLIDNPEVDSPFIMETKEWGARIFQTSIVKEIVDETIFKTEDAIYKIIKTKENEETTN